MAYAAIIVAQIVTVMILISLRRADLLKDSRKTGLAAFGLEIMLVPPLLAITDVTEFSELHPVVAVICIVVMFLGFLVLSRALSKKHLHS